MKLKACWIQVLLAGVLVVPAIAEVVAPGVEYLTYTTTHPNRVYVLQMERARPELIVHMGLPQKKRNFSSKQATSVIASQYDNAPTFDVLGAVNASFFGSGNAITGAVAEDGSVMQGVFGARETVLVTDAGVPEVIYRLTTPGQNIKFEDGSTTAIDTLNFARASDTVALYTTQWGPSTATTVQGLEIVISNVNYPLRGDKWVGGTVTAVRTGTNSVNNAIPANSMVISAHGIRAAHLAAKVNAGDRVEVQIDMGNNRVSTAAMMVTGQGWLLDGGVANTTNWPQYAFSPERHPRTVIAWNATHIFLVAIDGRRPGVSVGMNFSEMATFLSTTLNATDAVNMDGGGSTTMVVGGAVKNQPSDGAERAVANTLMIVRKLVPFAPFTDSFTAAGRLSNWDDKYNYNSVEPFAPPSPGGDGFAMHVKSLSARNQESCRVGRRTDTDYAVEADVYFDYRTENLTGDEVSGIFARDNGNAYWGSNSFDGGNCYAMAYAADAGTLSVGKYADGVLTKFAGDLTFTSDGWHRMRIQCSGNQISYFLDNTQILSVTDNSYSAGFAGVGVSETYAAGAYADVRGVYVDNFRLMNLPASAVAGWEIY